MDFRKKLIDSHEVLESGHFRHDPWLGLGDFAQRQVFQNQNPNVNLIKLKHRIKRKPNQLSLHLLRIFLCYKEHSNEQLFAALSDLIIILHSRGQALAKRMIAGSKSKLTADQYNFLNHSVNSEQIGLSNLSGNRYSVLSRGIEGSIQLINKIIDIKGDHDPLQLALDAIEYSQLTEAMDILEKALAEQPDHPQQQEILLDLYRSTESFDRFNQMYPLMTEYSIKQIHLWDELKQYFDNKH